MTATLLSRNDSAAVLTEVGNASGVQTLVQQLVKEVVDTSSTAFNESEPTTPGLILDIEVDGVRCLLFRQESKSPQVALSPREQEIARMVAKGYPNKTIAAVLDISSWTVGTHLRRIFAKLGVRTRAAMVARLVEENLITIGITQLALLMSFQSDFW